MQKFVTGDLFGIEKYLPKGTAVHLTRLREYKGRTAAIDEVLAYAEKVGVRRQVRSAIGQVCEELLMNALYDAPVDEHGHADVRRGRLEGAPRQALAAAGVDPLRSDGERLRR